jgi:hypothetical protein
VTRRQPTVAHVQRRTVRVFGAGALRIAELLDLDPSWGGVTAPITRLPDVRAAAQLAHIQLVETTPRTRRPAP